MNRRAGSTLEREFRANQEIIRILEMSKALSEVIFDELPVMLAMVDDDQRLLKVNRIGQAFLHIEEATALGENLMDFLPPEAGPAVTAYFDAARQGRPQPTAFETELNRSGERRFFHWQMSQVYRANQDRQRVHVLIGNDTTSARVAFEKLVDLRRDLEVGGTVQSLLLPKEKTINNGTFDIAVHYEPSAQVGGDLWWHRTIPGLGTLLVVCDVMGHGVGSAIASATFVGALETEFRDMQTPSAAAIGERMAALDAVLSRRFDKNMMFCTSVAWLPVGDGQALFWNMGLPPVIHAAASGELKRDRIHASDPLGVGTVTPPVCTPITMTAGDRLFVYSDGCYEFEYGGRDYGRSRFSKAVVKIPGSKPSEVCAKFGALHRELRGTLHPQDDVTLVVVNRS